MVTGHFWSLKKAVTRPEPIAMLLSWEDSFAMKSRHVFFLLFMVPALLAGVCHNPWVDAAALLFPVVMVGTVVIALAVRGLLNMFS